MDSTNDPIKALLEKTGLSCDDLLEKLLQYKTQQKKDVNETKPTESSSSVSGNTTEHHVNQTPVTSSNPISDSPESNNVNSSIDDENPNVNRVHHQTHEESEKESGPSETRTENFSSNVKHKEEVSRIDLKNGSCDVKENFETHLSISVTGSETNKDSEAKTKATNGSEFSEYLGEVLDKSSQNENEKTSSLNGADFSSGLKKHHGSDLAKSKESENIEVEPSSILSGSSPGYSRINSGIHNEVSNGGLNLNQRKSISDELVKKLQYRLEDDKESIDDENSGKINNNPEENDIEVCQIEDMEVPAKPLLKLRSDLFANNCKGNFHSSDNEDENEENNPEIREFLKNIEEVTGEVRTPLKSPVQTTSEDSIKPNTSRFRRVKMGFVKKRILHKAIKCINENESRKSEHFKRNGIFTHNEKLNFENAANVSKVSEEEIRKNLKLQLSSLRNRKKTTNFARDNCNKDDVKKNSYQHIYGKKKVQTSTINASTSGVESAITNNDLSQSPLHYAENTAAETTNSEIVDKEALFSLSKDADFMIVNVQGGVEFPESNGREEKNQKESSDLIKLTKTNDVTKIKGWQNKKFQLHPANDQKESIKKLENNTKKANECKNSVQPETCEGKNTKEELSPFVSNSLEEFLTENSTLNISYNIPKLGAEEGINTEKYNTVIIPQIEATTSEPSKKEEDEKEKPKSIKPKTLAEKRRMLESSKPKVIKEQNVFDRTSYVLYNGHKLFVPTTSSEQCLAKIKYTPKLSYHHQNGKVHKNIKNKKLSLLDIYHQNSTSVSYKPGPLSKKIELQNRESTSEWDTEIRRLPKIKLNIIPEIGKPIPKHLEHFLNFGPIIKEDRLELALSALLDKSEEKRKQGFSLTVPYANKQKYVLVRKEKKIPNNTIYEVPPEKNTVKSILDDIISYVENKENEDSILKDPEVYEEEDHVQSVINHESEVNPPRKIKRRKLDSELLRLSCKVLSVSVDETEETKSMCKKSFCKLGCVCKSLSCVSRLPMHCSKVECMFECNCSTSRNISLDGESGTLSCDTVSRLEDQAKRNLARVEKEFTQTIIHANDKTILIPSSDRKKTKRIKRMPKRYSDFLEDFDIDEKTNSKDNQENFADEIVNCYVQLNRLDVKGVIPLCLYHDCYNCACMKSQDKKSNPISDVESQEPVQSRLSKKRKYSSIEKKNTSTESKERSNINNINKSGDNSSDSDYMEELRIVDTRKFKEKGGCARAFGVHPEVLARNEIPFYKNKLRSKVAQAENSTFIDTSSIKNIIYNEPETEFVDVMKPLMVSASDRVKIFLSQQQQKKKQTPYEVYYLSHKAKKLKRKSNESIEEPVKQNKIEESLPYTPVFNGEIIVPTNENKDFVKKLGVKSAAQFMRLLPWDDLLKNYYDNKINIWCPNNNNNKLLMNVRDVGPPPGYIEITESKRKNGIMNWILSKELPKNTPSELVHLILSPKNDYFEISGICLKNITEEERSKKYIREKKTDKSFEEPTADQCKISNDSKFFKHKNHANEENILAMTQKIYNNKGIFIVSSSKNETNFISADLPPFESCRWRMVFLNSNFTFLSFVRSNYSIKYTDLKNILKMAQDSNKTICLQSKRLSNGYSQRNFGIYAVPNFSDNLFIGPYAYHEEHDLQTLRYLRQELVPTEFFEMVQGGVIPSKKKDVWLIPSNSPQLKRKNPSTLLHSPNQSFEHGTDDSEYATLTPLPSSSSKDDKTPESKSKTAQQVQYFHSHVFNENAQFTTSMDLETNAFVKFPQFTILNGKKMRVQDYNCYLITNVPDIGYLGAVKIEKSTGIEIDWPFGNKVLRFANVLCAVQFIRRRFMNLLLPVPATFNLKIILKEDVENLKYISPVDPKSLNGTHICGSFGILDSRKLTPQLAQTLGTTQEEVLQRLAKRAQFLGSLEIDKLKETEKALIDTKKELIMKKQNNLKKYMDLLMDLPEEQRLHEYSKFRQLFNRGSKVKEEVKITSENSKSADDVECIEIEDSDSEEKSSSEIAETSNMDPIPKKTSVMKSILKPNIITPMSPSTSTSSDIESGRPVENFKLVKTSSGKLILVKDNSGASLSKTLSGMKLKIKNNKVIDDKI